jgi:heavy metal sensor kinase
VTHPTLRTRLTIWFAASVLLILAPYLVGMLVLEWRSMRRALDHHLEEDLEVAAEMLVLRDDQVVWRTASERDLGYDAAQQRWVEVYGDDGAPLFFRGLPRQRFIQASMLPPSVRAAGFHSLRTPAGARVRTFTARRQIATTPVWVRVARSEDPLLDAWRNLLILLVAGTPIAVLGAALAGYLISGRMLRPLVEMAERARSISAERLSERLPIENPRDELGQLAMIFNETFARLEASFERLRRFSADVSHELRTPLTAIRSVGEVGLREPHDAVGYQEIIGSMLEEADRLGRLVDTLLTLARWESGRTRAQPVDADLAEIARQVVAQVVVLAEERDVAVGVSLEGPMHVTADAVMLRQAVLNVVDNAIKFTPAGRKVRVWNESDAVSHHLVVDDEGPGIPEEQRARVFERFHRIEGLGVQADGAGLGLAIVHWAVTANGGRVSVESSPAGGARLRLSFPHMPASPGATPTGSPVT